MDEDTNYSAFYTGFNEHKSQKRTVLDEAAEITSGARRNAYGHPENNFQRIANLWDAYLANKTDTEAEDTITPQDTALMMILLKIARLQESPEHRDSLTDIVGYAATVEMLWEGNDE